MTPDIHIQGIGMTSQRTRERMVKRLIQQGISNAVILDLMRKTPRHLFIEEGFAHRAYEDVSLPIGSGQTISQPYIVARMTELLLESGSMEQVLEIGTGCGYQTAILAPLSGKVFSIERIKPLMLGARKRLRDLRYRNVEFKFADGNEGWPSRGPFNAILSAAAPEHIPPALLDQLAIGGRLVCPVGGGDHQELVFATKTVVGLETQAVERVNFVPFLPGTHNP